MPDPTKVEKIKTEKSPFINIPDVISANSYAEYSPSTGHYSSDYGSSKYDVPNINPEYIMNEDYKERRAQSQDNLDKLGYMLPRFAGRVATSVADGTVGTVYGVGAMLASGQVEKSRIKDKLKNGKTISEEEATVLNSDNPFAGGKFNAFFDNNFSRTADEVNKGLQDMFPMYATKAAQNAHGFDKFKYMNTYTQDIADAVAFTVGGVATGKLSNKFLTNMVKLGTTPGKIEQVIAGASKLDDIEKIKYLDNAAKGLKIQDASKKLLVTAAAVKHEAGIEGRDAGDAFANQRRFELTHTITGEFNGHQITDEEEQKILDLKEDTENMVFGLNTAILGVGEFIQFGKAMVSSKATDVAQIALKEQLQGAAKGVTKEGLESAYKVAEKTKLDKLLAKPYIKYPTKVLRAQVPESAEEWLQYVGGETAKNYYEKQYHYDKSGVGEFLNSVGYGITEGMKAEGLDQALMGFVSGPFSQAITPGSDLYQSFKKDATSAREVEVTDMLNKAKIQDVTKEYIKSAVRHEKLTEEQQGAQELNDDFTVQNKQSELLTNYVLSRIKLGKHNDVIDELESLKDLTPEEFSKFSGMNVTEESRNKFLQDLNKTLNFNGEQSFVKDFIDNKIFKTNRVKKSYDTIEHLFPTMTQGNKDRLTYLHVEIQDAHERAKKLSTEVVRETNNELPGLLSEFNGKLQFNNINNIYVPLDGNEKEFQTIIENKSNLNEVDPITIDNLFVKTSDIIKLQDRRKELNKQYKAISEDKVTQTKNDIIDSVLEAQLNKDLTKPTQQATQTQTSQQEPQTFDPSDPFNQPTMFANEEVFPTSDLTDIIDQLSKSSDPEDQLKLSDAQREIAQREAKTTQVDPKKADIEKRRTEELATLPNNGIITSGDVITRSPESDKINAKYDAELAILDKIIPTSTIPTGTKTPTTEDGIDESLKSINTENIDDDNTSKKKNNVFVTNGGVDNGLKPSEAIYFRTTETIQLDGHKLLIVTKVTNPELYQKILDNDPTAKEYETKNKDHKGIWTILVDKNNNPVLVNDKFVQSTLETASRVDSNKIDVGRGLSKEDALKAKIEAIKGINKLRDQIVGSKDGQYSGLKPGEVKYLPIVDKSKGLLSETDENANQIHSAFEPKVNNQRTSNNVLGRIFKAGTNLKNVVLELVTFNPIFKGVKVLPGKLYTQGENGSIFDLVPRNVNESEVGLILQLINLKLSNQDLDFDPITEIKKIISFKRSDTAPQFQIYINQDNRLVFGNTEISIEDLQLIEGESIPSKMQELIDFLHTKRTNVNNKYIQGETFTEPSLDGNGKTINYNEYLLSGEEPMFGTDLKPEINPISGNINRRFIQTYFIYDPNLVGDENQKTDATQESKIQEDNIAPVVTEVPTIKKVFNKRSSGDSLKLDRLASIAKDKSKLTQEEKNWFKEKFPNIPIEIIQGLIQGKSLGQFTQSGQVLLSDEASIGTLYHEAFHAVTQLYLSKTEINSLYSEAAKLHPNKTRRELEEILAEDFVNYKKDGNVLSQRPHRNTIFRKLLNFIKDLIGLKATDIQQVYERLDKRYYTKSKIIGNREFSSLNRDVETKRITKEKGTKFIKDILDTLDIGFFGKLYANNRTPITLPANIIDITDKLHDEFNDKYQNETNLDLSNDYEYVLENWDAIIKTWSKRLSLNGINLVIAENPEENQSLVSEDSSIIEEENNDLRAGDAYQEGNKTSTLSTVQSPIRMLLRSLKQVDKDFKPILNDLKGEIPVDFTSTYNYLLKNTVGTGSSYTDLYNKIESLIPNKPEFRELLDRLGAPSSELDDEHFDFQTQFLQDFNKNRTNSIITIYDEQGNIRIVDANRQNEVGKVQDIWSNNLKYKVSQNKEGKLVVDTEINNTKDPIEFLSKLGMTFDKNTLAVITAKTFNDKQLNDSVAAIKLYIEHHKGDVTNLFVQVKNESDEDKKVNVQGRLNYLLNLEAQNTSLVNELSYISADDKTEYSVGENNGLSITANIINNAKTKEELFAKLPHLNSVGTEGSLWLDQLFDSKTGLKNEGIKVELELHNGIATGTETEESIKQVTRKGTKGDLLTQQISGILNGKSNYIVSADKSQEFILSLNFYNGNQKLPVSIEGLSKSFNNITLKKIFQGYFKSEFKRIALFELNSLGKNVDIYNKNGGKWTVFQEILSQSVKTQIKNKLAELSEKQQSFENSEQELNNFINELLPLVDNDVIDFFGRYYNEFNNTLEENGIKDSVGLPKDFTDKYTPEQIKRAVIVTDFINSIEQTKLFIGDLSYYKDLYKRTAMFAGTKQVGRIDEETNQHLNTKHPRKDSKLADGTESTIVYADVKTEKQDLTDWITAYTNKEFTEQEAYNILGFSYNPETGVIKGESAYGSADEGDAMGWGSLDFIKEFHKRIGSWTPLMEQAYQIIQKQVFDKEGNLVEGELLTKDQIALFQTLKLQYAGPISHGSTIGLFVPGGYKFTVMPLIPQMIAGKNLSKVLDRMEKEQSGISLFKSAAKFGTILNNGQANKFYSKGNNGEINQGELVKQSISYQYLGLQVKPSPPHDNYIFSTQFRKTAFIDAFSDGKQNFEGAQDLLNEFNDLIAERTKVEKAELIKELGINPESYKAEDVSKLVKLLTKASEERKLTDNIIDSLDVETVLEEGKEVLKLKFNIDSMVNKPKIDSMLMALVNSRLVKQKFNGDAYVLAPVTGMEKIGNRPIGTNPALRGYTQDPVTGKTLPAEVMIPMTKNYYPLLTKYKTLKGVNEAIAGGKIPNEVLELVGCRIPGQGMNSNEYLTIKEFLPEDSATTMIAHPDIVAKAGSDFDNDKLYTYRPSLDDKGEVIQDNIDNKIINTLRQVISNPYNFLALITPNSTSIISPIVDDIKYTKYVNNKTAKNAKLVSEGKKEESILDKEGYLESQKNLASNIKYTDLLKVNKKVAARYKLWLAKDEVGLSAIANAYGPLSQISGLTANKSYVNENGEIVEVKINFEHNEIGDKLNLGAKKDAIGGNNISEINNQLINIIVDAAKDEEPMVAHLNMTMDTLPIYLYLNRLGVPFEHVANFMAQPIISDYIEANTANKSVFLKATQLHKQFGVKKDIKKKYSTNLSKNEITEYQNKIITLAELNKYQLIENQSGKEFELFQLQVFNDFLEYTKEAQLFGDAVRVTNSDSSGLGQNINSSRLKLEANQKVKNAQFINGVNKILEKTFIKSFQQDEFAIKAYKDFYDTQKEEIIGNILGLANTIEGDIKKAFKPFSKKDKLKLINLIENDFINFVIQNYGYKNIKSVRERLFQGENSVAKRLLALKNKKSDELTETESKILNNLLIKELFPLIDKAAPNYNNVKIFSKRLDTFTSNQLTEVFRELKDLDIKLGVELMHLGILQSGLNNSHITFLGIIPHEYYNQLVKESFAEFNKKNGANQDNLEEFNNMFIRENSKDSTIFQTAKNRGLYGKAKGFGMYGKDFSLDNTKDYTVDLDKSEESNNFVDPNIVTIEGKPTIDLTNENNC